MFVAAGHRGLLLVSPDGEAWTPAARGKEGETFRAVAYGIHRFVAVGGFGGMNILAASKDGKSWQQGQFDAKYVKYLRGLGAGKDFFLGLGGDPGSVGDSKPFVVTSTDGLKWSDFHSIGGKHILRRVAWGNDRFVSVGDRGRRSTSTDSQTWTDAKDAKALDTLIDIAFGKGMFVGVGLHGLRMSSEDGLKWSPAVRGAEGEHLNSILFTGESFVAIGAGATYISPDGQKWERHANTGAPTAAAFGGGKFVGSLWKGKLVLSTDGISWKETYKADEHLEAFAYSP